MPKISMNFLVSCVRRKDKVARSNGMRAFIVTVILGQSRAQLVAQKYRPAAERAPVAAIMVFCQLRCQCIQRNGYLQVYDLEPSNLAIFPRWAPMPRWGFHHARSGFDVIIQTEGLEAGRPLRSAGHVQHLVLPNAFTQPRCYDLPPRWVLPEPFDRPGDRAELSFMSTFHTNKQLCESGWYLGSREGNAGGVCKGVGEAATFMFLDYAAQ